MYIKNAKKSPYETVDNSIENLRPHSIVFFAYDLENNENLTEIFQKKIEDLNSNLNNIFSLNNKLKEEDGKIILTGVNNIKISFSRKKSEKFGGNFFITEIILENLNVDISKKEKYFLQTFYYILKNLEGLNINYIDDSFTDILNKDYVTGHKECSVGEICSFIQTFKEKFLEEDTETPKYLELIKILSKKNFEIKELENLLKDEIFINEKDEILKELKKDKENSRKKIFHKYKEKIIAKEFQNVLNFYLEIRKIISKRAGDFQSDLDRNVFGENGNDLLSAHFLEKNIQNKKIQETLEKTKELQENSNNRKKEAIKNYENIGDNMINLAIVELEKLESQLINFHQNLEENFSKFESQEENFSEKNLNLSEKIISEAEKNFKKIPGFFQKILSPILSRVGKILSANSENKKETPEQKEKREIEEFFDVALKILAEKNFLEQKGETEEKLKEKLNKKIEFFKEQYKKNEIIQSLKPFFEDEISIKIYSYQYARNKYRNSSITHSKENKNSSFVFQFGNDYVDNKLYDLKNEEAEKYKTQSGSFFGHKGGIHIIGYTPPSDFGNWDDLEKFFNKYEYLKKLAFLSEYNFLYNENENKFYKLLYLKESFFCKNDLNGTENDTNIEKRIKLFFENLKEKGKIKNILIKNSKEFYKEEIGIKENILFEIELNSGDIIEIKLIDNKVLVLGANTEKISFLEELEKFFIDGELEYINNYQYYIKNSVENILKGNDEILNQNYILANFSKDFYINPRTTYNKMLEQNYIKNEIDEEYKKEGYSGEYSGTSYKPYSYLKNRETALGVLSNYIFKRKSVKKTYNNGYYYFLEISENELEELSFNSYAGILSRNGNSNILKYLITGDKEELYENFKNEKIVKAYIKLEKPQKRLEISNSYEIVKYLLNIDYKRLEDGKKPLYSKFYNLEYVYFLQSYIENPSNSSEEEIKDIRKTNKEKYKEIFFKLKNDLKEEIKKTENLEELNDFIRKFLLINFESKELKEDFLVNFIANNFYQILKIALIEEKKYIDLGNFKEIFLENLLKYFKNGGANYIKNNISFENSDINFFKAEEKPVLGGVSL